MMMIGITVADATTITMTAAGIVMIAAGGRKNAAVVSTMSGAMMNDGGKSITITGCADSWKASCAESGSSMMNYCRKVK
jgi:hypothetical protein